MQNFKKFKKIKTRTDFIFRVQSDQDKIGLVAASSYLSKFIQTCVRKKEDVAGNAKGKEKK